MTASVVIAVAVAYLTGIGSTYQLAAPLEKFDTYGQNDNTFRWWASCLWPITASIATGCAIVRKIQERRTKLPQAIANERRRGA